MRKLEKPGKFVKNIKFHENYYSGYNPSDCSSLMTGQRIDFRKFMGKMSTIFTINIVLT